MRHKKMKIPALVLFLLLIGGCSSGIIVHDQARAAELVVEFLTSLKSDAGMKLAYEWTDDSYKEKVSFTEFSRIVSSIRGRNRGADIRLIGFEVFGPKDEIVVFAKSEKGDAEIHFRLTLVGTKTRDYYLLDLSTNDEGFGKTGIYGEFDQSIIVEGV